MEEIDGGKLALITTYMYLINKCSLLVIIIVCNNSFIAHFIHCLVCTHVLHETAYMYVKATSCGHVY